MSGPGKGQGTAQQGAAEEQALAIHEPPGLPGPRAQARDQVEAMPLGLRWFADGFSVVPHPQGLILRLCDMTQAQRAIEALRARGIRATPTHLIVRAAALALSRHPEAHVLLCDYRVIRPAQVDIGLSVAGQTSYAPVLVIPAAERLPLPQLVPFLNEGADAARKKELVDLQGMRRTGWVIPFGALRRFILRRLYNSAWFRRKLVGTFQITCMSDVDQVFALVFYSGCALGMGRVADRVIAEGGAAVVRRTVWLTLALDHKILDGRLGGVLLNGIREVLESDELVREAQG